MSDKYSQKEEETYRKGISDQLTEIKELLTKTYEQTLKTNGRVNKHEWYFTTIWWVISTFFVSGILAFFVNYLANKL
jgi:hypothetical protein